MTGSHPHASAKSRGTAVALTILPALQVAGLPTDTANVADELAEPPPTTSDA